MKTELQIRHAIKQLTGAQILMTLGQQDTTIQTSVITAMNWLLDEQNEMTACMQKLIEAAEKMNQEFELKFINR